MEVVAEAGDGPRRSTRTSPAPPRRHAAGSAHAGHERRGHHHGASARRIPSANIIVITSYDADEDVYRAVQAGARGYLLKGTFAEGCWRRSATCTRAGG